MALHWHRPSHRKIRAPLRSCAAAALMFDSQLDNPAWVTAQVNFQLFRLIDLPEFQDLTRGFPFSLLGGGAIIASVVMCWLALIWGSGIERVLVIAAIIGLWAYWGFGSFGLSG